MGVNRVLLSYAAPCAKLLKNKTMVKEDYELYMNALKEEIDFPVDKFKKYFKMVCNNFDPEKVTDNEVRNYFFGKHNQDHPQCRVFETEVVECSEKVFVNGENGKKLPAIVYTREFPKKGQKVVYHIDGIVDIFK
ncbi:MAG: hypothetical protein KAT37_01185 [Candidatus Aenigmarchaeota archaeon]|nr:hypothetical protein [Candidatus Aenigmarchaeota archaeon]